ncbi:MAG: CRISPR-associated ring nuclease Csm6 [Rhodocyclales bacterium]|nr:CRISPR-associated ring nuclease Csm6 [Rhodocyclales bacterium]
MRKILLAVTGLSPQIVTETLYALAHQDTPWIPDEVHVITSGEGAQRVKLSLLDPAQGQFHALAQDYPQFSVVRFETTHIHLIADDDGHPLDDIRTPEDNAHAADRIHEVVRCFTAQPDTELHVSIAGGRKTMGFYLGYCLSMTARPQGRLSHVLVSEPFEFLKEFFFPPKISRVLHTSNGRPVLTSDARVMLAEIPFIRLRQLLPEAVLASHTRFGDAVQATQAYLETPRLQIKVSQKQLVCGGTVVPMEAKLFAFYAWYAQQALEGVSHRSQEDLDDLAFLAIYRQVVGESLAYMKQADKSTASNGFQKGELDEPRSRINRVLKKALGLRADPYLISSNGKKPAAHGLTLAPESICME